MSESPKPQLSRVNCTPRSRKLDAKNFVEENNNSPLKLNFDDGKENIDLKKQLEILKCEITERDSVIKAMNAKFSRRSSMNKSQNPKALTQT